MKLYESKAPVTTFIQSYFEAFNEINLPSLGQLQHMAAEDVTSYFLELLAVKIMVALTIHREEMPETPDWIRSREVTVRICYTIFSSG